MQESAFLMLHNMNLLFDLFIPKIKKNYNGAYGETLFLKKNCHNFRCVQGRVVIFGSRYGFGIGLINGDIYIYPRLTPVAMAT